jgi:hypothetical protein
LQEKDMPTDLLNGTLTSLANFVASVGGLGTAAYGLVDVTKAFRGGISNAGFGHVRRALNPFEAALRDIGQGSPLDIVRANWLNGVPQADQKAIVKSLIRLGLSPVNAPRLAKSAGIDSDALAGAANKIDAGSALEPQDINILGRFDAIVDAVLAGGFERADQQYRNSSKALAAIVAIILSVVGGGMTHAQGGGFDLREFVFSQDLLVALLVGCVATPLAPIAKDLSSSLTAAVRAVSTVRP